MREAAVQHDEQRKCLAGCHKTVGRWLHRQYRDKDMKPIYQDKCWQCMFTSGSIFSLCYDNAALYQLCCWNNNGRNSFFSMGEESECFELRAADFKTIVARSIFRPA